MRRWYYRMVAEVGSSVDARVRVHIEKLDEYWSNYLGFLQVWEHPLTASFLNNDLIVCVRVATEIASVDMELFCSKRPTTQLGRVWKKYLDDFTGTMKRDDEIASALTSCAQCFGEARDSYRALIAVESQTEKNRLRIVSFT